MSEEIATHQPGLWSRFRRWLAAHHLTLMTINDTPHSIALGLAIGIFFGFTPLLSMKTLLSIGVAWLCKSNKIAAAISVTLHDVILPFMPAIYFWEYRVGMWALHRQRASHSGLGHLPLRDFMKWTTFFTVGQPLLVGSLFLALPSAAIVYFLMRGLISRTRAIRQKNIARQVPTDHRSAR